MEGVGRRLIWSRPAHTYSDDTVIYAVSDGAVRAPIPPQHDRPGHLIPSKDVAPGCNRGPRTICLVVTSEGGQNDSTTSAPTVQSIAPTPQPGASLVFDRATLYRRILSDLRQRTVDVELTVLADAADVASRTAYVFLTEPSTFDPLHTLDDLGIPRTTVDGRCLTVRERMCHLPANTPSNLAPINASLIRTLPLALMPTLPYPIAGTRTAPLSLAQGDLLMPTAKHLLVDGSNVAHEGQPAPLLRQLNAVVAALRIKYPDADIAVFVDASFQHSIPAHEVTLYDMAVENGDFRVTMQGLAGKGDEYILAQADGVDGIVVSNDSYQQFQVQYPWLLNPERVLGVGDGPAGWQFFPRNVARPRLDGKGNPGSRRPTLSKRRQPRGRQLRTTQATQRDPQPRVTSLQMLPATDKSPASHDVWGGEARLRRFEREFRRANEQDDL